MATDKKQVEIPGRLHSVATEGVVAGANEILDDNKGKNQQEINASVDDSLQENKTNIANEITRATNAENTIKGGSSKSIQNLDSRLSTVEAHDTISMDGGSVVVGTAEDFTNRTTAGDAKIPTVGAILNGADEEPTDGSNNLVKSKGVAKYLNFISLTFNTDVATTRLQVPLNLRKRGLMIYYFHPEFGKTIEIYTTTTYADLNWQKNIYWYTLRIDSLEHTDSSVVPVTNTGRVRTTDSTIHTEDSQFSYSNPVAVKKGDVIRVITRGENAVTSIITKCDEQGENLVCLVKQTQGIEYGECLSYEYLVTEDMYVIISYNSYISISGAGTAKRTARIQSNPTTRKLADVYKWMDGNKDSVDSIDDIIGNMGLIPAYNGRLKKEEANYYYIDLNGAKHTQPTNYYSTSNPIYFKAGDTIHVYTAGADFTVVAKASSKVFADASFTPVVKREVTSGFSEHSFTVQEDGYYVVCWYSGHGSSYAEVNVSSYSRLDAFDSKINTIEQEIQEYADDIGVPMNVFGDVLPQRTKSKILGGVDDVEIVCVGDSLTGLIEYSGEVTEPEHCPPGMTYEHWTYLLWNRICLNKPVCDRLDSQRNGVDVFAKTGTWSWEDFSSKTGNYRDASVSAGTFKCSDTNAAISFEFDSDSFEKLNIVFQYINKGGQFEVVIQEGNGKLIASLDKNTYTEANGFSVNETYSPAAFTMRHRRVWMKKADGVTGTLHITVRRTDTTADNTFYLWGIEKWSGQSIFVTNIGRGGIQVLDGTTSSAGFSLYTNFYDIELRNPDLCILEPSLANDTPYAANSLTALKDKYASYLNKFIDSSTNTIKINLLVVLPHGRAVTFDGNQAIKWGSGSNVVDMINHLKYNAIFQHIKTILSASTDSDGRYGIVDLMQQLYSEGISRGYTIQDWLTASTAVKQTMTYDGIHLNNIGSQFWCKYLSPLFQ